MGQDSKGEHGGRDRKEQYLVLRLLIHSGWYSMPPLYSPREAPGFRPFTPVLVLFAQRPVQPHRGRWARDQRLGVHPAERVGPVIPVRDAPVANNALAGPLCVPKTSSEFFKR
jgi:hypothetical protein